MKTMLSIKAGSYEMQKNDMTLLMKLLDKYASNKNGLWLNDIDYHSIKYKFSSELSSESECGAMNVSENTIYVFDETTRYLESSDFSKTIIEMKQKYFIAKIFSTVIHELRHHWQRQKYGRILWTIMYFPEYIPCLYGKFPLEKDAYERQDEADDAVFDLIE